MMNCVLIVTNFNAGRKKAVKYKKKVIDFVLKYTKNFKFVDIDELKLIDTAPFDTILAVGGDGTVNKVLPYLMNSDKVLGVIPCGTANLLAAKLGMLMDIDKTLKILDRANIKRIDLLNVNDELCALRCGFGYDSDIICKTPQSLKNRLGYFAYFISGIIFCFRLKNKEYKMSIDTNEYKENASCVIFANAANMYRNFVSLAYDSSIDDGLIDIFILKTTNPISFFIEFLCILFQIRKNRKNAKYIQGKKICIESSWRVCHIDGEKKNLKESIQIDLIPNAINVLCK